MEGMRYPQAGFVFEELAEVSVMYTECPKAMGCLAQVVDTVDICVSVFLCGVLWPIGL